MVRGQIGCRVVFYPPTAMGGLYPALSLSTGGNAMTTNPALTPPARFAITRPMTLPTSLAGWLPFLFSRVLFPGTADPDRRVRGVSLLVLLVLPAALLYPTLGFHLPHPDGARSPQIPPEIPQRGEGVVPPPQGEPYLDKPPLMYWLVALSYRLFGVSPVAARLVPAVCVHLTIL